MSDLFILDEEQKAQSSINPSYLRDNRSFMEKANDWFISIQNVPTKEKVVFFRLLSTMVNSGLTLIKWVSVLEKQEKKQSVLKNILKRFQQELREWKGLSEAMALYPRTFTTAEIGIVESGEKTGRLNVALRDLADQIEKLASMNGKIKGALIYPAAIVIVVIGVIVVMMTMVVPKLLEIFEDKSALPASTQLLIKISDSFIHYWWLYVTIIVVIVTVILLWKSTEMGKYYFDKAMLHVPVFGDLNQKLVLSKFSRVLAGMLKSGVSIVESLRITADAVGNEVYRQRILFLRDDIKKWLKIYESLEDDPLFPEMMVSMIQIGEQTAKIDEIIVKVADFYDEEIDNTVSVIHKLLEPIIIVTMSVVVGFIAIAIMQPILNLADTISSS